MPKKVPHPIIDQQLDQIEGTNIHICAGEPADYADIANHYLAQGVISGSYSKANGDTSGRKTTCPPQTGLAIDNDGTADHVVISNGVDTIVDQTTCTPQALTSGDTVDTNAFDHEVGDPT